MSIARRTSEDQLVLFETGLNLARLRASKDRLLMQNQKAFKTSETYASAWKHFQAWCADVSRSSLPASTDTLELFVTWALTEREPVYSISTIVVTVAAITSKHKEHGHPSPMAPSVRAVIRAAEREPTRKRPKGKEAIRPEHLAMICQLPMHGTIEIRNRAMILFAFASGLRSAEVASFDLDDLRWDGEHALLWLNRSKTDQRAEGRRVRLYPGKYVATCPVHALRRWLEVRGSAPGPIFCAVLKTPTHRRRGAVEKVETIRPEVRISGEVLNGAIKESLERIGVDPTHYGSHSLRAGMVTAAAENGASEIAIRERTGHKNLAMLAKYVRAVKGLRSDPLAGVL